MYGYGEGLIARRTVSISMRTGSLFSYRKKKAIKTAWTRRPEKIED
jgi:hypothetical protein